MQPIHVGDDTLVTTPPITPARSPCPTCQTQQELEHLLEDFSRFVLHPTWLVFGIVALIWSGTAFLLADWETPTGLSHNLTAALVGYAIIARFHARCTRYYHARAAYREHKYLELLDQYDYALCRPCTCPHTRSTNTNTTTALACIPSELYLVQSLAKSNPNIKAV
ncbi:MAG: hypothetical protein LC104_13620 [Bacteroidales bacterium]|nr:hypothetical protein [Bacteroidales bacterium]